MSSSSLSATFAIAALHVFACVCHAQTEFHRVEAAGMVFTWHLADGLLHGELVAPGAGWVAVGFNTRPGLAGTHLLMSAATPTGSAFSERAVLAPGRHEAIESLGGTPIASLASASQAAHGTTIAFTLPLGHADAWRHPLASGHRYHLLLAYSHHDDFGHHSAVRRHLVVAL